MKEVFFFYYLMLLFTSSSLLAQHQNAAALTSTSHKEEGKGEEDECKTDKTTAELGESRICYIHTLLTRTIFKGHLFI